MIKINITPETRELNRAVETFDRITVGKHDTVSDIRALHDIAYAVMSGLTKASSAKLREAAFCVRVFRVHLKG